MLAALAAAVLLAAPAHAGEAPLLEVVSSRVILTDSFIPVTPAAPLVAPLSLVVEQGSSWQAPGMLEHVLGKASAIFARCGVTLGAAEVVSVRWSAEGLRRLNVQDPYKGPEQTAVMGEPLIPARRPIGFLFQPGSVPSTAKAYNKTSLEAFKAQFPDSALLRDTFWITLDQQVRKPKPDEAESFSVFAHELTHLFGDLPHTRAHPNLMTDDGSVGAKSGDLTDEQCAAIRLLY
jgi:hypothetical protein